MSYITLENICSLIPLPMLTDALDDDRDGVIDENVLSDIIDSASNAVDALICGQYVVPMSDPPANMKEAALQFACERIYDRRQVSEKNPFRDRADYWRKILEQIGEGKKTLSASGPTAGQSGTTWGSAEKF